MADSNPNLSADPVENPAVAARGGAEAPSDAAGQAVNTNGGYAQGDDVNVSLVAIVGVFAVILLFLMVVLLQAWFYSADTAEEARKTAEGEANSPLVVARAQQESQIRDYHWVDKAKGVRGLPIEQAMKLEQQRLAAEQAAGSRPATP